MSEAVKAVQAEMKNLTEAQLVDMISTNAATVADKSIMAALDAFRKDIAAAQTKAIIPTQEGNWETGSIGKSFAGSWYDSSVFGKVKSHDYPMNKQGDRDYALSFLAQGGFWTKLSPALEQFALLIKSKGRNFNLDGLRGLCTKQMETLAQFGYKAAAPSGMGDTNVGFDIPIEFPAVIIEAVVQASPLLQRLWRFSMNENSVSFPKLMQDDDDYWGGVITAWEGTSAHSEGQTMTESHPETSKVVFTAKRVTHLVILTDELMQDSPINILNYITGLLVRKLDYDFEKVVIVGNGTTQPLGVNMDPEIIGKAMVRNTVGQVLYKDIIKLDGELNEIFRNYMFVTRKATLANVRSQVGTDQRPMLLENWASLMGTATRTPDALGNFYHLTRNCPVMGQRGDLIVGDFSMYGFGMRLNQRIDISDAPGFIKNETYVRLISRVDGKPMTPFAFKILEGKKS